MNEAHGKKFLKKFFVASLLVSEISFLLVIFYENNSQIVSVARAEIKTYEAIGRAEFNFGENNPQLIEMAKNYARMTAVQAAKEKAGIYLKSFSRTLGGNLTDDDISVVASNSVEIVDVKFKQMPYVSHDIHGNATGEIGIAYEAVAVVKIDSNALSRYIKSDEKEKSTLIEQNKLSQRNIADINKQVEDLKRNPQKSTSIEIQKIDNQILVQQKIEEGNALKYEGNHQGAISKYNEAIQLNPNYSNAYYELGTNYLLMKYYEQAIKNFDKSIELEHNFMGAYYWRGVAYDELKDHKQAIKNYSKVIELNPSYLNSYSYAMRGYSYFSIENYEQAIKDLSKFIELNPDDDFIDTTCTSILLCYLFSISSEVYEQALKSFSKAIELNPDEKNIYMIRGHTYRELKNYETAIKDYSKTIQLNSGDSDSESYYWRGKCYQYLQNYKSALQDFNKAIELSSDNKYYYRSRGECYKALGNNEQAEKDFAKARQLGYNG